MYQVCEFIKYPKITTASKVVRLIYLSRRAALLCVLDSRSIGEPVIFSTSCNERLVFDRSLVGLARRGGDRTENQEHGQNHGSASGTQLDEAGQVHQRQTRRSSLEPLVGRVATRTRTLHELHRKYILVGIERAIGLDDLDGLVVECYSVVDTLDILVVELGIETILTGLEHGVGGKVVLNRALLRRVHSQLVLTDSVLQQQDDQQGGNANVSNSTKQHRHAWQQCSLPRLYAERAQLCAQCRAASMSRTQLHTFSIEYMASWV
jgi:hypothetical protein